MRACVDCGRSGPFGGRRCRACYVAAKQACRRSTRGDPYRIGNRAYRTPAHIAARIALYSPFAVAGLPIPYLPAGRAAGLPVACLGRRGVVCRLSVPGRRQLTDDETIFRPD
jgi:hypothetical protein